MKIVFCIPGNNFSQHWLKCWNKTVRWLAKNNIDWDVSSYYDPIIYNCRNIILGGVKEKGKVQSPWQGQLQYDWQIWIDSDMIWTTNDIEQLISHADKDIVTGFYMRGSDDTTTTSVADFDGKSWIQLDRSDIDPNGDLMLVDATGFGFLAIKNGVVESLEYPWFRPVIYEDEGNWAFMTEDSGFCHMAKAAGFEIYADPKVRLGHEKTRVLHPDLVGGFIP
jgi:hypothetical protein